MKSNLIAQLDVPLVFNLSVNSCIHAKYFGESTSVIYSALQNIKLKRNTKNNRFYGITE